MTSWIDCPSDDAFADDAADFIAGLIKATDNCVIGLSGGSTPGPVYQSLGARSDIDWSRVTMFLIDERCVMPDDKDVNARLITSAFPNARIILPDTSLKPEACASDYAKKLDAILGDGMDIAILGMGPDGHIASLFPPLSDATFGPATAIHTMTDTFAVHDRVSVTLPILKAAKHAVFLLRGDDKKRVWDEMMESENDERRWPAKAILETDVTVFFRASA